MKINVKTIAGVGVGLVAGYLLFKNKNKKLLYIGGTGLAGGLLANLILNREEKKKPITLSTKEYIQEVQDELNDSESGNIELEEIPNTIPNLQQTSTKDNFDIDLDFAN